MECGDFPLVISTKRSAWSARLCRLACPRNLLTTLRMTIILNNGDVELFDEPGAGFGKGEILVVHNELEKVAFGPTDEALEYVLLAGEVKGWVLVVVIRTDGPAAFLTGAF